MPHEAERIDLDGLTDLLQRRAAARTIVAIAGPPGAGKSLLAESLAVRLNAAEPACAAVLQQDSYHLDDGVLSSLGLRSRKGAPETFDVAGLRHMLSRLARNEEDRIAVPVFDRGLEIARAGARLIPRQVRHLIVEGNYLLLDRAPWSELHALFDVTVMIAAPEALLRQRLTERWRGYGLSPDAIAAKVEANDLPNARLVRSSSIAPQFIVEA